MKSYDTQIIGQKINMLTALELVRKDKRWHWKCLCDCGNIKIVRSNFFTSGKTASCGCATSRLKIGHASRLPEGVSVINQSYRRYMDAAKKRKYSFDLTKEEFAILITQNCHYCNSEPQVNSLSKNSYSDFKVNGVDRVDNRIGYTSENCVSCCKSCNIAKRDMSGKEFIFWIKNIYNNIRSSDLFRFGLNQNDRCNFNYNIDSIDELIPDEG